MAVQKKIISEEIDGPLQELVGRIERNLHEDKDILHLLIKQDKTYRKIGAVKMKRDAQRPQHLMFFRGRIHVEGVEG